VKEAERAVEAFARKLMARDELVTWDYDKEGHIVVLYVPDDVDATNFPEYVAGVPTQIEHLPRPIPFATRM